jgi:hypothetical protein
MIVLLVLSLLATIVLFSVNGFNSDADKSRKDANCKQLQTADAAWYAAHPSDPSAADNHGDADYKKYFTDGKVPTAAESSC